MTQGLAFCTQCRVDNEDNMTQGLAFCTQCRVDNEDMEK